MRLLVCGDRNWNDSAMIFSVIETLKPDVIIQGGATGADSVASDAAKYFKIPCIQFDAEWNTHGKAAGPIRNRRMLVEGKPDLVLAFHDDIEHSKGTKDVVKQARKDGVPVKVYTHAER